MTSIVVSSLPDETIMVVASRLPDGLLLLGGKTDSIFGAVGRCLLYSGVRFSSKAMPTTTTNSTKQMAPTALRNPKYDLDDSAPAEAAFAAIVPPEVCCSRKKKKKSKSGLVSFSPIKKELMSHPLVGFFH